MQFQKATKQQARARVGLIGPSGSGKTYTALAIAQGLGTKVALIDTERGSASKYADEFEFAVLELDQFDPREYVKAINAAAVAGFDVLIIDSLSHAWSGAGGALELVDKAAKKTQSGNSFGAWREVTPLHNQMVDAILRAPLHVIATMRAKTDYVQEKDERTGRTQIRKVGLAPVQRDGLEYEFDVVADIDIEHNLIVTKTRCRALDGAVIAKPGADVAATLKAWLTTGAPIPQPTPEQVRAKLVAQAGELFRELNSRGYTPKWSAVTIKTYIDNEFMVTDGMDSLTHDTLPQLIAKLNTKLDTLLNKAEAATA
jgi:hypothetical protein